MKDVVTLGEAINLVKRWLNIPLDQKLPEEFYDYVEYVKAALNAKIEEKIAKA